MRIALDTNVLVYAAGYERTAGDLRKVAHARWLLNHLEPTHGLYVATQAVGELFNVLTRKRGLPLHEAAETVRRVTASFDVFAATPDDYETALDLAVRNKLQIWDAVMLAAAAVARCEFLLSEDMQDGFVWRGLTIVNPFAEPLHPLLASLLDA